MRPALLFVVALTACQSPGVYESHSDREGIRRVVREHSKGVSACYEKAIDERPGAEGKLVMSWDIGREGIAENVAVKQADPKISHIGPCMAAEVATWRFPKLTPDEHLVSVSYPFFFSENGRLEVK